MASGEIENGLSARTASARACPGGCTGTSHAPLRQNLEGSRRGRADPSYALPGQATLAPVSGQSNLKPGSGSHCRKGSTSGRRLTVPCTVAFEPEQWKALIVFKTRKPPPEQPPTLRQMILLIAQLGGFLGRKSDGQPGAQTLWRGLHC